MIIKNHDATKYYKIVWGGPFKADPEGLILVKDDLKGFNEYRFWDENLIEDWPEGITFYVKGKKHEDYVVVGLHWTIVSERVHKCFEELNVKGAQFLPVHIIIEEKKEEIGPYWALHVIQEIDALDWEKTRWLYPERDPKTDRYPMMKALKVALKKDKLEGIDIFRLNVKNKGDTIIYISERLMKYLDKTGATVGFKFRPILAY
jgi:hypothetical protein